MNKFPEFKIRYYFIKKGTIRRNYNQAISKEK